MNSTLMTAVLCLLLPLAGITAASAAEQEGLTGDPGRGGELYIDYKCYACHGYTGETGSGARLNPSRFNQRAFIAYVRAGNMADRGPPAGSWMPAYAGEDVSDQELADIYAWLMSLESTSPPLEDIPLLRASE